MESSRQQINEEQYKKHFIPSTCCWLNSTSFSSASFILEREKTHCSLSVYKLLKKPQYPINQYLLLYSNQVSYVVLSGTLTCSLLINMGSRSFKILLCLKSWKYQRIQGDFGLLIQKFTLFSKRNVPLIHPFFLVTLGQGQ